MSDLGDEGEQKLDLPLVANEENIKIIVQTEQDQENKSNFQNPTTSLDK